MSGHLSGFSQLDITTAIEDNLFEHSLSLGTPEHRQVYDGSDVKWVYTGGPVLNRVLGARFGAGEVEGRIADVLARFKAWNVPLTWVTGPSTQPDDLGTYLEGSGLKHTADWCGMALDLLALPEIAAIPAGLTIQEVTGEEALWLWTHLASNPAAVPHSYWEAFHQVFAGLGFGEHLPWRHYLGLLGGEPVARSMLFTGVGVAGVYWVLTAPEARKQGIGTALTFYSLQEARTRGHRMAILQASAMGEPIYRRMGFSEYCKIGIYAWKP